MIRRIFFLSLIFGVATVITAADIKIPALNKKGNSE